jgi:hypothetical protein
MAAYRKRDRSPYFLTTVIDPFNTVRDLLLFETVMK